MSLVPPLGAEANPPFLQAGLQELRPAGKMHGMYISYRVRAEDDGRTAEEVLRRRLRFSASLCRRLRNEGGLTADGQFQLNAGKVREGALLEVRLCRENELEGPLSPSEPLDIVYEDEWFAAVSKPPQMPTHPRFPGDRALTTSLSDKMLHPANRLDTDTSGLVLIAKNAYAHDLLTKTPMQKIYKGLVHGIMPRQGLIDAPITRAPDSIIMRRVGPEGKEAVTHYVRIAAWPGANASLMAFRLETGRTHQIRVHCQYVKHPLVGDTLYGYEQTFRCRSEIRGRNRANYLLPDNRSFKDPSYRNEFKALALNRLLSRQFLHAERLRFVHPVSGVFLDLYAKLPDDLCALLRFLNRSEKLTEPPASEKPLLALKLPPNVRG